MNIQRGACEQAERKFKISTLCYGLAVAEPDMDNAVVGIVLKKNFKHIPFREYAFLLSFLYSFKHKKKGMVLMKKTHLLTELAVAVALAVVCSFIKIWEMPQGGSISLTMVPILLISFRRGVLPGMAVGGVYGLISLAIAGVIYHPMSILLDYVLAFGMLGLAGFFRKNLPSVIAGTIVGVAGRFICSLVSGAVLFASYAPEGQNPWVYSLIYQASYLIPELIISLAIIIPFYIKKRL